MRYSNSEREVLMKIWKIWGNNLPELYVNADSFDNALAIARKRHPLYCVGQIQSKGGVMFDTIDKNIFRRNACPCR